jgi:thiamine-phosphate pyrophosphorylase
MRPRRRRRAASSSERILSPPAGRPPALYVITDRQATGGRPLLQVLEAVLRGARACCGEDVPLPLAICLREKDLSIAQLTTLAQSVCELTKKAGVDLFINGRVDVALACSAEGVHLPSDGLAPADVRSIAPHLKIAVSTHTVDEVDRAAREKADFVVFGPIFATPSKQGLLVPRGLEGLRAACGRGVPVLALGGIFPDHARLCDQAGASGVAVIRAVISAADPAAGIVAFLARYRKQN